MDSGNRFGLPFFMKLLSFRIVFTPFWHRFSHRCFCIEFKHILHCFWRRRTLIFCKTPAMEFFFMSGGKPSTNNSILNLLSDHFGIIFAFFFGMHCCRDYAIDFRYILDPISAPFGRRLQPSLPRVAHEIGQGSPKSCNKADGGLIFLRAESHLAPQGPPDALQISF